MILRTCSFESCDSLVEGNTHYCATHNAMLRKQAKQAKQVKIVHQPRKVSAKMAKDLQDYGVLRKQFLIENPECEAKVSGQCNGIAVEVHHSAKRAQSLLQADTFVAVCRPCHVHIETKMSAEERRERGLLISKTNETI